jgi:hypothetical protein
VTLEDGVHRPLHDSVSMTSPPLTPVLSVVVPSVNTLADVERALTALERERHTVPLEILLVDRLGEDVRAAVRGRFPLVRIVEASSTATIPAMRKLAFATARGEFVAVIEDHVIVPPGWARALVDAERAAQAAASTGEAIVGGSVENAATRRIVDWAAFLCEYSHCLQPLARGPSSWITGNNVIYPRALLGRYLDRLSPYAWENHLHDMMRADGVVLMMRPEITVGHQKYYTLREYLSQRYQYARSYAAARVANASLARRAAVGAAVAALPPLLFARTVARIWGKRRHRLQLFLSLPYIAVFVIAWTFGDVVGSWFGAGDSFQKVC